MKRPAIFFDRDNTLIACNEYLGDPSKVSLVTGAADAVARARALGFSTVVFSNQSGVARGYFDETAVHSVNQRMDELLAEHNQRAIIDRHEFCPDHPEGAIEAYRKESTRRKPAPGMIYSAADALALDLSRSWVIGDAPRDIEAGKAAGLRTILFSDPQLARSPAADAHPNAHPDYVVSTLREAMDYIERSVAGIPDEPQPEMPDPEPPASFASSADRAPEPPPPIPADPSPVDGIPGTNAPDTVESAAGPVVLHQPEQHAPPPPAEPAPGAEESPSPPPPASPSEQVDESARRAPLMPRREHLTQSAASPVVQTVSTAKMEQILGEMLRELRKRHTDVHDDDFSVTKLLAGIVQVVVLAVLFLAYLYRHDTQLLAVLIFALTLQTMTIALLIMGKQR